MAGIILILVDKFEPKYIYKLIRQAMPVEWADLNHGQGMADYAWACVDGHVAQVERKQTGEILGGMNDVEDQLRKELAQADELILLIEGVMLPNEYGITTYKWSGGWGGAAGYDSCHRPKRGTWLNTYDYGTKSYPKPGLYSMLAAWLWSLSKAGVEVVQTPCSEATAMWLVSAYKQGQKEEHTTLDRYVRVKKQTKNRDPMVLSLMGLKGVSLGEVRAKALVREFGNIYQIVNADVGELCKVEGIGDVLARRVLKAMGRDDV